MREEENKNMYEAWNIKVGKTHTSKSKSLRDCPHLSALNLSSPMDSYDIQFIENYAQKNGFWAVDMFSTYAPLNKYFNKRKWFSTVDSFFISVPYLYHPLEVRNPATTSLIYWSKNNDLSFFDVHSLYLTKQDSDLDRPTMDFIRAIK